MVEITTIERTVVRGNSAGTGFLTAEEPGKWFNLSRFVSPTPIIPAPGTHTRVTLDGKGFVRAIELVDSKMPSLSEDAQLGDTGTFGRDGHLRSNLPTEIRLALLQAAATFLATRTDAKSTDVLTVAQVWESWLQGEFQLHAST